MRFRRLLLAWPILAVAQNCVSIPGGCEGGHSHDEAIGKAIDNFAPGSYFGGDSSTPVVFAAGVDAGAAAFISYSCADGSIPPRVEAAELLNL